MTETSFEEAVKVSRPFDEGNIGLIHSIHSIKKGAESTRKGRRKILRREEGEDEEDIGSGGGEAKAAGCMR